MDSSEKTLLIPRRSWWVVLLALIPFRLHSAAEPHQQIIPRWFIRNRGLKPVNDTRPMVPAENIVCHGEDEQDYRLSDVIAGIMRVSPEGPKAKGG